VTRDGKTEGTKDSRGKRQLLKKKKGHDDMEGNKKGGAERKPKGEKERENQNSIHRKRVMERGKDAAGRRTSEVEVLSL